jgi:hypothetical protein
MMITIPLLFHNHLLLLLSLLLLTITITTANNNNQQHIERTPPSIIDSKPSSTSGTGIIVFDDDTLDSKNHAQKTNIHQQQQQHEISLLQLNSEWHNNAKPIVHYSLSTTHINNSNNNRQLQQQTNNNNTTCIAWEDQQPPPQPPPSAGHVVLPWIKPEGDIRVCKVFIRWQYQYFVCSATLVGSDQIILSRHCSYSKCLGGLATETWISCGYSWINSTTKPHLTYDHWGSAKILFCQIHYQEFDASAQCVNNVDVSSTDYDIQICNLDREIGLKPGWFELTSTLSPNISSVIVRGYPGVYTLIPYFGPGIIDECMFHNYSIDSSKTTSTRISLNGAYLFGGESGAGYVVSTYNNNNNNNKLTSKLIATHRGGPSRCEESGTRVTSDLISRFSISIFPKPPPYCELVPYYVDMFNNYIPADSYWGVIEIPATPVVALPSLTILPSISVVKGSKYQAVITIFNPGNKRAINVMIKWWVSLNDVISEVDKLVGISFVNITAWQTYRVFSPIITVTQSVGTTFWIGAIWNNGNDCLPRRVGNQTPSGKVIVMSKKNNVPTNKPTTTITTRKPTHFKKKKKKHHG